MTGAAGSSGVATPRKKSFLDTVERIGNRLPDPVLIFVWLIVAVIALSAVGAAAGWVALNPVTKATLNATSLLSSANLERFLVEMPRTLTGFAPLGYVLLVMLGAGIAERTGLFGAAMRSVVRMAPARLLTPIVLFAGIMGNQAADAAFVILPPLAAALYAAAGRHPLLGIAVAFAGVAGGFSANLLPGGLDALLLGLTEPAARLLDPDWRMNIAGNWYFIAAMAVVFIPLGWWVAEKIVAPRLGPWTGPLQPSTVAAGAAATATATGPATEASPPGMAPGAAGPSISTADEKRGLRAAMIAARGRRRPVRRARLARTVGRGRGRRPALRRKRGAQWPPRTGPAAAVPGDGGRLLPAVPGRRASPTAAPPASTSRTATRSA